MKRTGNTGLSTLDLASADGGERRCAVDGCEGAPDYPAPRSRWALSDRIWLCLDHVRAYNGAWDYYAGMSEAEIEAHRRADVTWQRPTWPLGARGGGADAPRRDPFGLFGDGAAEPADRLSTFSPAEREALSVLGLVPPVGAEDLKAHYKALVKKLHPDANGGDVRAEERLKLVNQAYNTLRSSRTF